MVKELRDRREIVANIDIFFGQFVHPVRGDGVKGWMGGIVILASYEFHFIKVHNNLVYHVPGNILIQFYIILKVIFSKW